MDHIRIPVILTFGQINRLLVIVGKEPFSAVNDLMQAIKDQGDVAVKQAQDAALTEAIKARTSPPGEA